MRRFLLGILVAGLFGCGETYAPFASNQIAAGMDVSQRMEVDSLLARVQAICDARLADPSREDRGNDCGRSSCVYSRSATENLIRQWVASDLLAASPTLQTQVEEDGGFATTNLWLDFPGTLRPDEWVLAIAHYDAWFCGANDNATGTATLFEMAKTLALSTLDRSVRILWVDGEEYGMVGSNRYLRQHTSDRVVMVLNADMTAFMGDQSNPLTNESDSVEYWIQANQPSAGASFQFAQLAKLLPEPVMAKPMVYPKRGISIAGEILGYSLSDHAPFWMAGIPALFPFPTGDIPSWYHSPRDIPSQVDEGRLRRAARMWLAGLAAFATVEQ
jgi:hypothetical protein